MRMFIYNLLVYELENFFIKYVLSNRRDNTAKINALKEKVFIIFIANSNETMI